MLFRKDAIFLSKSKLFHVSYISLMYMFSLKINRGKKFHGAAEKVNVILDW